MNGVVVTLVVLAILASRKGKKGPVKLDLGGSSPSSNATQPQGPELNPGASGKPGKDSTASFPPPRSQQTSKSQNQNQNQRRPPPGWENYRPRQRSQAEPQAAGPLPEKNLNVVFNWNGHSWDAYEVLGIPAGSSRDAAAAAYQAACAKCDPESLPFLRAAFEAILKG